MHFEKAAGEPCLLYFYCHLLDDRLYLEVPKGLLLARPKIHKSIQPVSFFVLFVCLLFSAILAGENEYNNQTIIWASTLRKC